MRVLFTVIASTGLMLLGGAHAVASCAPPAPVAENAARAESVIYGTVTSLSDGAATMRVDRVLKGSAAGTITVWLGPGRGGSAGTAVATSVDYTAAPGTDHVLYLIRGTDGQLETSACIGSHAGPPTAEEQTYFGAGGAPAPGAAATAAPEPLSSTAPIGLDLVALIGIAALALASALLFWRVGIFRTR